LSVKLVSSTSTDSGYWIEGHDEPTFFPGRSALIKYRTPRGKVLDSGSFGILHPDVLAAFQIYYPGSAVEINIEPFL
jgi:phenylalanyl-tRNA synthetase beta chain